jgi:hypothetical protein
MDAALGITNENDTDLLRVRIQDGLKGELCSLGQGFTLIQDEETGGGFRFRSPIHTEKGKYFLTNGLQTALVGGVHGNTHERLSVSPDAIHEPRGARCFS